MEILQGNNSSIDTQPQVFLRPNYKLSTVNWSQIEYIRPDQSQITVYNQSGAPWNQRYQLVQPLYQEPLFGTYIDLYQDPNTDILFVSKRIIKKQLLCQDHIDAAKREIEIHSKLSHPNIVQLYSNGETDEEIILLLEYLENRDYFVNKIETNNIPFNLKADGGVSKLRSVSFDILHGLNYLHQNNLVYMDIKPGNLLISNNVQDDEWPLVKICDFGLTRPTDEHGCFYQTKRCGTEPYIAPEIGRKAACTQKVDLWSFGMLLHCLAVGYFPYALNWKPGQELRFPERYWRKYKGTGLTELIQGCLQSDPAKRISAAEALESAWILG